MGLTLQALLPAQSAGGGDSTTLIEAVSNAGGDSNIVQRAELIPPAGYATVTGVATNNATFTVRQLRAGSVVTADVASVTLAVGKNLVAETPLPLVIDSTVVLQAEDVLDCVMHQNGSGIAVGANVKIEVEINANYR